MRIIDLIRDNPGFISLEFFPPKDEQAWPAFFEAAGRLKAIRPLFASVTYGAGGGTQANTLEIVRRLKADVGMEPMAHLTCVGADDKHIQGFLDDLEAVDAQNVLALRGDPPRGIENFVPDNERFQHASDLVGFIKERHPEMCVGVAGYPEGHPQAPSIREDFDWLKYKLEAGADFATTQLFFDNRLYFDFVERMRAMGVDKPFIPGVLPIMSLASVHRILTFCGVSVPGKFFVQLQEAHEKGGVEAVYRMGIDHAVEQVKGLLDGGAPGVHLYTLNRADACLEIAKALGR